MAGQRIDLSDPNAVAGRKPEPEVKVESAGSNVDKAKMIKIVASIAMLALAGFIFAYTNGVFDSTPTYTPEADEVPADTAPETP